MKKNQNKLEPRRPLKPKLSVLQLPPLSNTTSPVLHTDIGHCKQVLHDIIEATSDRTVPQCIHQIHTDKSQQHLHTRYRSQLRNPVLDRKYHNLVEQYHSNVGKMFTATKAGANFMAKRIIHRLDPI